MDRVIQFIEKKGICPRREFRGVELVNLLREFEKEIMKGGLS